MNSGPPLLTRATLAGVPQQCRVRTAPAGLRPGIVHLGLGAFHRAHQAVFTEDALAAGVAGGGEDWGIVAVAPRSRATVDQLAAQDGLFSVTSRSPKAVETRVVGVLSAVLHAASDPLAVVRRIADPATRVLTLTVTEKAYRLERTSGRLRTDDPQVRADLAGDGPPMTVPGLLVRGLVARARADAGPLTVACCDNLPDNGRLLAGLVEDALREVPAPDADRTRAWLERQATFPCSMVDRIVPAPDEQTRRHAAEVLGAADRAAVATEPFHQWVVQDAFAAGRPPWQAAGVVLTGDVAPWERLKLRVLNGTHSALAYLGALAGRATISETLELPGMREFVDRLCREDVTPTLRPPDGVDVAGYAATVLERFGNPLIVHRTLQVAMDGSQKLPQRIVGTVTDRLRAGAEPRWAALAVAAWMRFVAGTADDGSDLPLDDPLADRLRKLVREAGDSPSARVDALLGVVEIFGAEPAGDPRFRALVTAWLRALADHGVQATLAGLNATP